MQTKAKYLIENVLKPKHILPPPQDEHFNYLVEIDSKWHRSSFYFFSTYACPGPNAISPTFEQKFVRMEHLGDGTFAICYMRHTGRWFKLFDSLSVDESMKVIRDDDAHFAP